MTIFDIQRLLPPWRVAAPHRYPTAGWIGSDGQRANGPVEARPEAHSGGAGG